MKPFSSWKDEKKNEGSEEPLKELSEKLEAINESIREQANPSKKVLEERLNSSDYLKKYLGFPLLEKPETPPVNESLPTWAAPPVPSVDPRQSDFNQNAPAPATAPTPEPEEIQEPEEVVHQEVESDPDTYKLYRDREESFECNISIEGASLSSAQVRLVIDTNIFNVVFYGKLYKDGKCLVPLKKMNMLPEYTKGQIRLEVVVDDTMFVPWESACVVEGAKKVHVDIKQKKNVSVNFGTSN